MLDLKKLQVFVTVMEQRSFSRAAEICHLSQPTVSGHIKALEDHFGTVLLDRHTREVVPTRAGTLLYRYAKRLVRLANELEREMELFLSGGRGRLLLGGSTIPGQYVLPEILGSFRRLYPEAEISLEIASTREVAYRVLEGEIEIGVVGAKIIDSELVFEPCLEDEIILVMPPQWEIKEPLDLEEITKLPLIVREKGSGTWFTVQEELKKQGIPLNKLNIVAEIGSTEAIKQAVKAGLGAAFISKRAVKDELQSGLLKTPSLDLTIKRSFYLVTPERRTLSPVAQLFIDFFKNYR